MLRESDLWVWSGVSGNARAPIQLSLQLHLKNCEGSDVSLYVQGNKLA